MLPLFAFLVGITLGSFLNTCIYRLPRGESILAPASYCPECRHRLTPLDLIPLGGYLLLKGKCRYCGHSIPWRYPLVELGMGLTAALLCFRLDFSGLIPALVVTALLVVVTCTDLEHGIIPDALVLPALYGGLLYSLFFTPHFLGSSLAGAFLGGGILLVIALASRGGMGGGDIKLMAALGAWLGWRQLLVVLFLSFFLGGIGGLWLLLLKVKKRSDAIPFAPFIAAAVLLTLLGGDFLHYWYSRLFLRIVDGIK